MYTLTATPRSPPWNPTSPWVTVLLPGFGREGVTLVPQPVRVSPHTPQEVLLWSLGLFTSNICDSVNISETQSQSNLGRGERHSSCWCGVSQSQQRACKQSQLSIYFLRRLLSLWVHSIFYHQISVRQEILPECHATQRLGVVLFFRPSSFSSGWCLASLLQVPTALLPSLSSTVPPHLLSLRKQDLSSTAHQWAGCLWVTVSFLKTTAPAECWQGLSQVSTLMNIPRCLCVVS